MHKEPRVTVSCRIPPDLKWGLENSAEESGLTVSHYLEQLIVNRDSHYPNDDGTEEPSEQMASLEPEIRSLKERLEEQEAVYVNELNLLREKLDDALSNNEHLVRENSSLLSLKSEFDELSTRNRSLIQQSEELSAKLERAERQLPFQLMPTETEQLVYYLEQLSKHHPDVPQKHLLLGSLDTAIRTEGAIWTVPTINHYLKKSKIPTS